MATLHNLVRYAVEGYAVKGANFESFLTVSLDGNMLTVVDVAKDDRDQHFVATSLVVRFLDEYVIIEHDDNDKPLIDALLQAGVSRKQIVLAYEGERVPEAAV